MIREWITLLRLARKRARSYADYWQFQVYQGYLIIDYLKEKEVDIAGVRVLDLGCGNGGYSYSMTNAKAQVISIDLRQPKITLPTFALANALRLPFASSSFPVIFCASLIEHLSDPAQLLTEIERVLTPDGSVYLSFPPFYSPVGGHQFKPYHLLGERWALHLSGYRAENLANRFGDYSLYPLTISHVQRLIAKSGLGIKHCSTRFFPLNMARLPWLGEFLTWHVQFILNKGGSVGSAPPFSDQVDFPAQSPQYWLGDERTDGSCSVEGFSWIAWGQQACRFAVQSKSNGNTRTETAFEIAGEQPL